MGKPLKIALWALAGLLVLLIAAGVLLSVLYPKEKIIATVTPRAEQALGRKVTLNDAGISFWPPFGVALRGMTIHNRAGYSDSVLFSVGEVRVDLQLLPLLAGKIVFDEVALRDLAFHYEVGDDGVSNIADILEGESASPQLLVEQFRLENARLVYRNRPERTSLVIDSLSAAFRVDPKSWSFDASLDLPQWTWTDAGETTVGEDPIQLRAEGRYHADSQLVEMRSLAGTISALPFEGSARLSLATEAKPLTARVELGPVEIPALMKKLPASRRAMLGSYVLAGDLKGTVRWQGPASGRGLAPLSGEVVWLMGSVRDDGVELMRFDALSVPFDSGGFHVVGQSVVAMGGPVKVGVLATGMPPEKVELTLSGETDLGTLATLLNTEGLAGRVTYAISASGPTETPERWSIKMSTGLKDVQIEQPGREALGVPTANFEYDGRALAIRNLNATSGRTRLAVQGSVSGLDWPQLLADSVAIFPRAELTIQSPYCDLDGFFPELAPDTAPPAQVTAQPPLPAMSLRAEITADTLIAGGAEWRRMRGRIRFEDGRLWLDTLMGQVYGGKAALAGSINLANPSMPEYDLNARADSVHVDQVLSRFCRLGSFLRGAGSMTAEVDGKGTEFRDLVNQLTVEGSALLFDATLVNLKPVSSVMALAGLPATESVPVRSLRNAFRIDRGRVQFDEFRFSALESNWNLAGSAGLDGTLDYSLDAVLSEALSGQFELPAELRDRMKAEWLGDTDPVDLLKNDDGRVELAIKLEGDYSRPKVGFDWDRMLPSIQKRFEERVAGKLKESVEEKAKEGLKGLFDKLKK